MKGVKVSIIKVFVSFRQLMFVGRGVRGWVHFTLVHRYDFITGKRADIRRGDSWGWGFFHERLIRPYIYIDETIGVGNKKQTRPIVVRCPQRRSLVVRTRRLSNVINSHCPRAEYPPFETPHFPRYHDEHILH